MGTVQLLSNNCSKKQWLSLSYLCFSKGGVLRPLHPFSIANLYPFMGKETSTLPRTTQPRDQNAVGFLWSSGQLII